MVVLFFFFFQAEEGIRDYKVTGVQTCALPICPGSDCTRRAPGSRWSGSSHPARRPDPAWKARVRYAGPPAGCGEPAQPVGLGDPSDLRWRIGLDPGQGRCGEERDEDRSAECDSTDDGCIEGHDSTQEKRGDPNTDDGQDEQGREDLVAEHHRT